MQVILHKISRMQFAILLCISARGLLSKRVKVKKLLFLRLQPFAACLQMQLEICNNNNVILKIFLGHASLPLNYIVTWCCAASFVSLMYLTEFPFQGVGTGELVRGSTPQRCSLKKCIAAPENNFHSNHSPYRYFHCISSNCFFTL